MGTPSERARLRRLVRAILGLGTFTLAMYWPLSKALPDGNEAAAATFTIVFVVPLLVFARK